jgi:hypothetical protein
MKLGLKTLWLIALVGVGCGDDGVGPGGEVVGGACTVSQNCAVGSECLGGKEFPGGTCALRCNAQSHCPDGTECMKEKDGVCLLACRYPQDCRLGYSCKGKDRYGLAGEALVCIAED